MVTMLQCLQDGITPFEFSCSGLDLGAIRCRILTTQVAYNETLLSLHLAKKQIQDSEGKEIARMLLTNKTLRKIELERNNLGI